MDVVDPPAEASSGAHDMNIKRETSDGLDGDTKMADIPESTVDHPNPPPASLSHADGAADPKLPATVRTIKKKGTATLVKKTSHRRVGGGSRAGKARGSGKTTSSSKTKKSATASSASSPPAAAGSSEAGSGDEEDEESDHGPYCLCRGPDDHRWMIGCDMCEDWFHGECVSIDKTIGESLIQRYVCPRCTDDKGINVTRYKKACSLEGCVNPARIYDETKKGVGAGPATYSVFCSDRHAEDWWEQLVRSLPENSKLKAKNMDLTRDKFMGLLGASTVYKPLEGEDPWYVGKKPFAVPSEFWSQIDHALVFTPEEQSFLSTSAADRYALAEEIVLNKKMQQLLDLANERRKAAITASLFDKDTCGYDARLDLVGSPVEFAQLVKSAQGEAIYKNNSLAADGGWTDEQLQRLKDDAIAADKEWNVSTAGMCDRRRCKPHAGWYNIFTKNTRHIIKELARQAKEKLDAETRVREAAATRYFRKRHERTSVTRLDGMMMVT